MQHRSTISSKVIQRSFKIIRFFSGNEIKQDPRYITFFVVIQTDIVLRLNVSERRFEKWCVGHILMFYN